MDAGASRRACGAQSGLAGETEIEKGAGMKPHIRLIRGYWCVFKDRTNHNLISLTSRFEKLSRISPWKVNEITCQWFGDAKPS
jgi:hypothetical protein